MGEILNAKIKQKRLVNKFDIYRFIDNSDLDKKIETLITKGELKAEQDKIAKLQAFYASYFRGKSHYEDDDPQNYLVFQPVNKYVRKIANSNHISSWMFQGLPDENIKLPAVSNNSLAPALNYINTKLQVKIVRHCLKRDNVTVTHKQFENVCIIYEINLWSYIQGADFTLVNSLFGAVKSNAVKKSDPINILILDMILDLMHAEVSCYLMGMCLLKP